MYRMLYISRVPYVQGAIYPPGYLGVLHSGVYARPWSLSRCTRPCSCRTSRDQHRYYCTRHTCVCAGLTPLLMSSRVLNPGFEEQSPGSRKRRKASKPRFCTTNTVARVYLSNGYGMLRPLEGPPKVPCKTIACRITPRGDDPRLLPGRGLCSKVQKLLDLIKSHQKCRTVDNPIPGMSTL